MKMEFIKKNKILVSLLVIAIVFFAAIMIIIFSNLSIGNNEYGNRLDNIEKYPISDEAINEIKTDISSYEKVTSVSYNLEGKLANFILTVDDSLEEETAKNYANKILENLSDDVKSYYDIQVLVDSDNEESEVYPIIGYKHKTTDMFVWKQ
ncbi:MAG: hypothetical protein MR388_02080 [Tenericutes bacterium]|jgi:uncharacterized membrane protein|nr:hypothetical protein [Mycoplasmatota bacterium]